MKNKLLRVLICLVLVLSITVSFCRPTVCFATGAAIPAIEAVKAVESILYALGVSPGAEPTAFSSIVSKCVESLVNAGLFLLDVTGRLVCPISMERDHPGMPDTPVETFIKKEIIDICRSVALNPANKYVKTISYPDLIVDSGLLQKYGASDKVIDLVSFLKSKLLEDFEYFSDKFKYIAFRSDGELFIFYSDVPLSLKSEYVSAYDNTYWYLYPPAGTAPNTVLCRSLCTERTNGYVSGGSFISDSEPFLLGQHVPWTITNFVDFTNAAVVPNTDLALGQTTTDDVDVKDAYPAWADKVCIIFDDGSMRPPTDDEKKDPDWLNKLAKLGSIVLPVGVGIASVSNPIQNQDNSQNGQTSPEIIEQIEPATPDPEPGPGPDGEPVIGGKPTVGLGSFLGNIFQPMFDGLLNGIKAIFVPSSDFLSEKVTALRERFSFADSIIETVSVFNNLDFSGGPPVIYVHLEKAEGSIDYGQTVKILDMSFYERYKPSVDLLLSSMLWCFFCWRVFIKLPDIIGGSGGDIYSAEVGHEKYVKSQLKASKRSKP